MKLCAVTMVYRDYWALAQWYRHYGAMLGHEHLYIIAHGPDPRIAQMCPQASILTIPRDDLSQFDKMRGQMLNSFQAGLLNVYDWVLRTDTDELICVDPDYGPTLHDVLARQDAPAVFALGLNVLEMPGDAPLEDAPVFMRRRAAVFSGHYSKAFAVREPVALMRHGVQLRPRRLKRFPFVMPQGCYMAHLKFANLAALQDANLHRLDVAARPGKGMPGPAWQDADQRGADYLANAIAMPLRGWAKGLDKAYGKLTSEPVRDPSDNVLKARILRFKFRTELPDWFAAL